MAGQNSAFDEDLLGSPSSVHAKDSDYTPNHSDAPLKMKMKVLVIQIKGKEIKNPVQDHGNRMK